MKNKRMGRPPAPWMHQFLDLKIDSLWTDAYDIAKHMDMNPRTVKSFLQKLNVEPKHVVENGKARARFKVKELKIAAKAYIKPWL